MNINQRQLGTIKNTLNRSADNLDDRILSKLATSRHQALSRSKQTHQLTAEHGGGAIMRLRAISLHHEAKLWIGIALIVFFSIAAHQYWERSNDDHADIDFAILTDELPIDVYVD